MNDPTGAPPSAGKKTSLLIGVLVGGVLLCLCCLLFGIVGIVFRERIPGISTLFATSTPQFTPTPEGIRYDNARLGIHLYYPMEWYVQDFHLFGNAVAFTSLPDLLDLDSPPRDAVALVIVRDREFWDGAFGEDYDVSPQMDLLDAMTEEFVGDDVEVLKSASIEEVGGYPGARALYKVDEGDPHLLNFGILISLSGDVPTFIMFVVAEPVWSQAEPVLEGVLSTLRIDPFLP